MLKIKSNWGNRTLTSNLNLGLKIIHWFAVSWLLIKTRIYTNLIKFCVLHKNVNYFCQLLPVHPSHPSWCDKNIIFFWCFHKNWKLKIERTKIKDVVAKLLSKRDTILPKIPKICYQFVEKKFSGNYQR